MTQTVHTWAHKWGLNAVAYHELMDILDPSRTSIPDNGPPRSEAALQSEIMIAGARLGCNLWRNNSGALKDEKGRLVRYGLGNTSARVNEHWKSSDLIGIAPHMVRHQDVGTIIGRFIAVEVKAPGWRGIRDDHEKAQNAFLQNVRATGGIGVFAASVADVFGHG